jgi:hypothetical protein
VRNESAALALDIAATARLKLYDEDKEARLIEALIAGSTNSALSSIASGLNQAPKPSVRDLRRQ